MRLFVTGATGLIGRRLLLDRIERGDEVVALSRRPDRARELFASDANPNVRVVQGDPSFPGRWQQAIDGCEAVVHLAGAGVADHRWSASYKTLIKDSRIDSTHQIVEAIRAARRPPPILVNASAVGYYGDTGHRPTDESAGGDPADFLGGVTGRWEAEATKATELDVRVVMLRFGVVLDERGGMLEKMVKPFRLFLGGPIGSGRQYVPWIHRQDVIRIIDFALGSAALEGAVNGVAPNPVTNREFCAALGEVLHRPNWLRVPPFVLRGVLGEIARYATMSQRIIPTRLLSAGFHFSFPELRAALRSLLEPPTLNRREILSTSPATARASPAPMRAAVSEHDAHSSLPAPGEAPAEAMPPRRIRLVAVAVDGTLLRGDGRLSQGVIRASRAVERAGAAIVLATARPPRSMRSILEAMDITGPTINYNGALIWNPLERTAQFHEPLDAAVAGRLISAARSASPQVLLGIEVLDHWFTDRVDPAVRTRSGLPLEPDAIGPVEEFVRNGVTQVNFFGSPDDIVRVRRALEQQFWRQRVVALFQPDASLLQVTHPLADKGIALQRVARRLTVDRSEVMAIGSQAADRGMIEWAGFSVAMGNAEEQVKRLARAEVASSDENGVAIALHRYVLDAS